MRSARGVITGALVFALVATTPSVGTGWAAEPQDPARTGGPVVAALPEAGTVPTRIRTVRLADTARVREAGSENTPYGGPDTREVSQDPAFSLVVVTWDGQAPDRLEVRSRTVDGTWSPWSTPGVEDSGPDHVPVTRSSEPVWVGRADRVQVRAWRDGRPVTDELTLVAVDGGTSDNDLRIAELAAHPVTGVPEQPPIVTRAQWGADESLMTWPPEYVVPNRAVVVHHTFHDGSNSNNYTCAESARIVRSIYTLHAVTNGWGDIGYHVLVDKCGVMFEGRAGGVNLPVVGGHALGFNQHTFGIAMIGDFRTVTPQAQQLESVARTAAWKLLAGYQEPLGTVELVSTDSRANAKYPAGTLVTLPTILGHRDANHTECPGDAGYAQLGRIRQRVGELAGAWRNGPIYQRWQSQGGEDGWLGPVFAVESDWAGGGRATGFTGWGGPTITWHADAGTHWIGGAIQEKFWALGGPSVVGYPVTDELPDTDVPGARFNEFTGDTTIMWSAATGAHEVRGVVRQKWWDAGGSGVLGLPVTDTLPLAGREGLFNEFTQDASILWSPGTGAHVLSGELRRQWWAQGAEQGPLGLPISDAYPVAGGLRQDFEGGSLVVTT
ncbi:MAG TPA: N-acetylmuramoyl-L-alanine amidase [Pseudonocardiaceae bacterium]